MRSTAAAKAGCCPTAKARTPLRATAAVVVDPDLRGRPSDAPAPARSAAAPEVVWRLPYKQDGVGYLLQRQIHLFTVDLDSGR